MTHQIYLIVGTFSANTLYTLRFTPPTGNEAAHLEISQTHKAAAPHGWLALSQDKRTLYATKFSEPASLHSYQLLDPQGQAIKPLNSAGLEKRSAYVCASSKFLYSSGGPNIDVFALDPSTGAIGTPVQSLSVLSEEEQQPQAGQAQQVLHGDFGGVRHGTHSCDLSIDGRHLYIADIGRNCIWTYAVDESVKTSTAETPHVRLASKTLATDADDGPRHAWPHPNGKMLYCVQEHSSMVDSYEISEDGGRLELVQPRLRCIPAGRHARDFWADEVRTSWVAGGDRQPRYLYASTRGLEAHTKGYVAVWELDKHGRVNSADPIDMYETPTSGGWANATSPAPVRADDGTEYLALTDSQEGWVFILSFDGKSIKESARLNLSPDPSEVIGAATALWLD